MGNCSLSRELVHHSSQDEEQPAQLQPSHLYYLKPSSDAPLLANFDLLTQSFSKPMDFIHAAQTRELEGQPQSPIQSPATKAKVAKKVTFAKDLVQTPSSNQPVSHEAAARGGSAPTARKQEAHHRFTSGEDLRPQKEELVSASPGKKEVNGVVRLKVVISKKQLSELISSRSVLGNNGDANLMEKMLAPLLPQLATQVKSSKSGQPWRPSLHHIPEAYSTQELFINSLDE